MSRTISYRGLIGDGEQQQIALQTIDGLIGYKITKFELMPNNPGVGGPESVVKIYKTQQSSVDGVIDFSDNRLLGAAFQKTQEDSANTEAGIITIFDNEKFNQDIYVTAIDVRGALKVNYYIELEQMKLDLNEQTVATLKDIRNVGAE